jgi:hypothetical protein
LFDVIETIPPPEESSMINSVLFVPFIDAERVLVCPAKSKTEEEELTVRFPFNTMPDSPICNVAELSVRFG